MCEYATFTSESVSEGHPDKMADQISDAIVDAMLEINQDARVAVETLVKTGMVILAGEIRLPPNTYIDYEAIVRRTITEIGYTSSDIGFDAKTCAVINAIGPQSCDIACGVDETPEHEQGAGDQGLMFGYATDETPELMPAPITFAHRLMKKQAELRKSGHLPWLRPDAKSQITFRYANGKPVAVDSLVLSTQHDPDISQATVKEGVREEIIKAVISPDWEMPPDDRIYINPTGRFEIGGPVADCGITGRKIIVDTYGGMARHGGGAFSGKDPSKVDRAAAYGCRYVAKNLVSAGLAKRCELQIAYAIGFPKPVSIEINTFGTGVLPDAQLGELVRMHFDLSPKGLIDMLDLKRPIYRDLAAYGHFGREESQFTWEQTDRADTLRADA